MKVKNSNFLCQNNDMRTIVVWKNLNNLTDLNGSQIHNFSYTKRWKQVSFAKPLTLDNASLPVENSVVQLGNSTNRINYCGLAICP